MPVSRAGQRTSHAACARKVISAGLAMSLPRVAPEPTRDADAAGVIAPDVLACSAPGKPAMPSDAPPMAMPPSAMRSRKDLRDSLFWFCIRVLHNWLSATVVAAPNHYVVMHPIVSWL